MSTVYREYLKSTEWNVRRNFKLKEAGYKCQLCGCGTRTLNVHHRDYKNVGNENPWDLTVLCSVCHNDFHTLQKLRKELDLEDESLELVLDSIRTEATERFETELNYNIFDAISEVLPAERTSNIGVSFRVLDGTDKYKSDDYSMHRSKRFRNFIKELRSLSEEKLELAFNKLGVK